MSVSVLQFKSTRFAHTGCLLAAAGLALLLNGCDSSSSGWISHYQPVVPVDTPTVIEADIDTLAAQIGGATQDVALYNDGATDWTLYSMANRFANTKVGASKDTVNEITVPGYIQHITVVNDYGGKDYALLSMGDKGIGIVDITNPAAMVYVRTMTVNYMTPEYKFSDGGGTIFTEEASTEPHTSGPVNDVLVDNQGTPETTDDQLFIANTAYGIQKTKLSNLMDAAADGVLAIDSGVWTLKYAGEIPWGGPLSLQLHDDGTGKKLYAALGFLGISIYDPDDLTAPRLGTYNLYADCDTVNNPKQEDWFGYPKRKIACPDPTDTDLVLAPTLDGVDPVDADGMPTYVQAAHELGSKNNLSWYPWAEFEKYGKYYYKARGMDLVNLASPDRSVAYIAYSLGGLVAVDVTDPASPKYLGFVPAAPAHGPDEPPVNLDQKGILSHFGSGMLKEAGVMDARIIADTVGGGYKAYYTDHFAGLVVVSGAEAPENQWNNGGLSWRTSNDTDPRVFWPDYEFVDSYDMHPVPVGEESLPAFLVVDDTGKYVAPMLLSTGEINGHGGALFLMPCMENGSCVAGDIQAVQSSGAGGVSFIEFLDLSASSTAPVASRFAVPVNLVSTDEIGAYEDGTPGQPIAIGHAEGVKVSGNHLYLADGPHGVSVWTIADGLTPVDDLHLVANSLQSEYPTPGSLVRPTPHAFKVFFDSDNTRAYVMSQSLGMRRVDVSAVTSGSAMVGAPALLDAYGGIFEHNTEAGSVVGVGGVTVVGQDHTYGVEFSGKYAIVADGDNGLTIYDTTVSPDPVTGTYLVANIGDSEGAGASGKPPLGRAASVKLWTDPDTGNTYAVVAAGAYGISVVDMTAFLASGDQSDLTVDLSDPANSMLLKTFEPLKADDDNAFGSADGKSVDVHIIDNIAYFSYDSFGLVAYHMEDLIRPAKEERPVVIPDDQDPEICATITDVTKLSVKQGGVGECRPTAIAQFKLQKIDGYEEVSGGALYMTPQYFPTQYYDATGELVTLIKPRLLFYVAYGDAGVAKIDWSEPEDPILLDLKEVIGGAVGTAINNGRVYTAAGAGGLSVLK
jgi:hypothetical protein